MTAAVISPAQGQRWASRSRRRRAASAAYGAAWTWGQHVKYDDPDDPEFYERQEKFDQAEHDLLVLIRQALSIPEGEPGLPLPGYTAVGTVANEDMEP